MASAVDGKTKPKTKTEKLVVAAIDFGTTYSGYAFSFRHDFDKELLKISANTSWVAGTAGLMSQKTPTILLLKPDKTFEAFGYEAEDRYSELTSEEDHGHEKYYYFRRFKMMLNKLTLMRNTILEDDKGLKLPASLVFSFSIKYLMEHLKKTLHNRATGITDDDIQWVLTVPAIWNDGSKQFMREAAEKAGIKTENLLIALEPEAASLFCMHLPLDTATTEDGVKSSARMAPFCKGTKYMVVDVGGGTVDITVHEVVDSDKLKELSWASGGAWGGTRVDKAFEVFLGKIFTPDVIKIFSKEATEDLVDLHREFETKKRTVRIDKTGKETFKLPARLIEMYEDISHKTVESAVIGNVEFKGKINWTAGKLRIDAEIVRSWFDESCNQTVKHVKELFNRKSSKDINIILLVGGFSESPMMQSAMKQHFPDKRLIVPEEAGLAVLRGAVLFGHNPITVVSRIAKCSYGIRVYRDFKDGVHPNNKRIQIGTRVKCIDVFARHVEKGQELIVGEVQSNQRYTPLEADQVSLVFDVYTSTDEDPQYVTDVGCTYVGQLEVEVPELSGGKERGVFVKMIFGGTEVTVEGEEERTKKVTKASFDFLQ